MEVFYKNQQLFDQERFKGKNSSSIVDLKQKITECNSSKLADFKARRMRSTFRQERLKDLPETVYGKKI